MFTKQTLIDMSSAYMRESEMGLFTKGFKVCSLKIMKKLSNGW